MKVSSVLNFKDHTMKTHTRVAVLMHTLSTTALHTDNLISSGRPIRWHREKRHKHSFIRGLGASYTGGGGGG
jgi:hypothetical protein